MDNFIRLLICAAAGGLVTVYGFQSGKVTSACDEMRPGHMKTKNRKIDPQPSPAPYIIIVSNRTVFPEDIITVTITSTSGNETFKGFFLQARPVKKDEFSGTFSLSDPNNTQLLQCGSQPNTAVSHTNNELKTSIEAYWTAPNKTGCVQFVATVVKEYRIFWTGIKSDVITIKKKK
ncbi:putative defense protein 3 isoform X2 [Dendropsophus ebraccatus]